MTSLIISTYRFIFARKVFFKWNRFCYRLSLNSLGVLNHQSSRTNGESHFLKNRLKSKDFKGVIIDVGANKGDFSLSCHNIRPDIKTFCIEPHPVIFQELSRRMEGKNTELLNVGVSSIKSETILFDYSENDGSAHASIYSDVIETIHGEKSIGHKIQTTTIDDLISLYNLDDIGLLKIDTEGHEIEVLKGASKSIKQGKIACIHFEFNEMNVISRVFFKDFLNMLENYEIYRLLPQGMLHMNNYNAHCYEIFAYQNLVAFRKEP